MSHCNVCVGHCYDPNPPKPCSQCGGKGEVRMWVEYDDPSDSGLYSVACPKCHGTKVEPNTKCLTTRQS